MKNPSVNCLNKIRIAQPQPEDVKYAISHLRQESVFELRVRRVLLRVGVEMRPCQVARFVSLGFVVFAFEVARALSSGSATVDFRRKVRSSQQKRETV